MPPDLMGSGSIGISNHTNHIRSRYILIRTEVARYDSESEARQKESSIMNMNSGSTKVFLGQGLNRYDPV
jgi:hypothetical protein